MATAAMKYIALNFSKLDKFKGVDFRRWQKKMYFLLSSMSVVYMLTTPSPEDGENVTMEHMRRRNKWENDDYVCKGVDFRRWQKKMYFLLSSISVVYMLTTPSLEDGENATMEHMRRNNKWENDDYV
ncbi:hypothetical protein Tco_1267261 [Tanacetum coccineum]